MAEGEKDRFGEKMKLLERAKEDIYFAQRDRELLEKLRKQLKKVETGNQLRCPKCGGILESHEFQGFLLDRCRECGGIWMDNDELESVVKKLNQGPLGAWIDKLTTKD
jgi:tRNA(Ile2) C34 agmatinyltransferase TiaS